jgi:type IV pilus assembly protein PilA
VSRLMTRAREERGFTLIEILVVVLIIGVLAAIALPSFLGQKEKSEDADAKSNARNLMSQVESCFTPKEDYRDCATEADLGGNLGIPYGSEPGQAEVTASTQSTWSITAVSRSKTGATNRTFTITREPTGGTSRTCTGCSGGAW